MKTTIYNLIILDESGSMSAIKSATIRGFNQTLHTIKEAQQSFDSQQHLVSLVTFGGTIRTIFNKVPVEQLKDLHSKTYEPGGMTPLFDAIGKSVNDLKLAVGKEESYAVLVTILTDGEENASREYRAGVIKRLIRDCKKFGWVFTYIGANHDVAGSARQLSIDNVMEFVADEEGTTTMNEKVNYCKKQFYRKLNKGISPFNLMKNFFDEE